MSKIYIDKELPGYKTLTNKLNELGSLKIVGMPEAEIVLKYAHNANRDLKPLGDFILTENKKKTLFFSWFDFYDSKQSSFFRDYNGLWAKSKYAYKILQLPYNYSDIKIAIKELNPTDYAK
jgi:hypothetical protein